MVVRTICIFHLFDRLIFAFFFATSSDAFLREIKKSKLVSEFQNTTTLILKLRLLTAINKRISCIRLQLMIILNNHTLFSFFNAHHHQEVKGKNDRLTKEKKGNSLFLWYNKTIYFKFSAFLYG